MPISGLGSSFALGVETVYGTGVTTTVKLPFMSESVETTVGRVEPDVLWPGQIVMPGENWRGGSVTHAGSIDHVLYGLGQEELWRMAFGGYSFATGTHTFTPALATESHTHAFGFGGDTAVPTKTYDGGVCTGWTFSLLAEEEGKLSTDFVYQGITNADSGTIAGSTPAGMVPLNWTDVTSITVGGQAFDCVRGFTLTADNGYTLDRVCLGSAEIKDPRVHTSMRALSGSLTVDFEDFTSTPTVIPDFLTSAVEEQLIITLVNGVSTFTFTGNIRIDGSVPNIAGLDIVQFDVPFMLTSDVGDDSAALTLTIANGTTTL